MIKVGYSTESMNEARQRGHLYHFTSVRNIVRIIESNKLSSHHADDHTDSSISLTRSKTLRSRGSNVRITLDGDKLSNNHKIKPINIIASDPYSAPWDSEFEERVVGDIDDLKKFIVSVDLHIRLIQDPKYAKRTQSILDSLGMKSINELIAFFDKNRIPHGTYGKMSDKG